MDFNTLLVIVVDGGLSVFLLYAIYTTRQGRINYRETITTPQKQSEPNHKLNIETYPNTNA